MIESLFVISDLHLGGAPARDGKPGFQMCSPQARELLAEFIAYVASQRTAKCDVHLLINGDIVDFLAEEQFAPFTGDDAAAREKLRQIIDTTKVVWESLRKYVSAGGRLTLLLGNHDVELSLPAPKTLLMETIGPGLVEFIVDNQAFVRGPVLIEHGNRYDKWNAVAHDTLRAIRSALSRKEKPVGYSGPAGSQLVYSVMNRLKAKYPFVDLLKPEGPGVLPILAVLDPSSVKAVPKLAALAAKASRVSYAAGGIPVNPQNIRGRTSPSSSDQEFIRLAYELAGFDPSKIGSLNNAKDLLQRWKAAAGAAASKAAQRTELELVLRALRSYANSHRQAFNVDAEDAEYLEPANAAAERGFEIVIYGHTHLPKRVDLARKGARYFNTGTWADVMKVPTAVVDGDDAQARRQLGGFLRDLDNGNLSRWRGFIPTFARVDLEMDHVQQADLYVFDGKASVTRVPEGVLQRMEHS